MAGLVIGTALIGALWAMSVNLVILDVNVAAAAKTMITAVEEVNVGGSATQFYLGKSNIIQGINLFDVRGVATEFIGPTPPRKLVLRLYMLNPQDWGSVTGNKHAYVLLQATSYGNPDHVPPGSVGTEWTEYGQLILTVERPYGIIMPVLPIAADSFRVRATIVVPGGSPQGAVVQRLADTMRFRMEVSPR
jgi:hypothetical protein